MMRDPLQPQFAGRRSPISRTRSIAPWATLVCAGGCFVWQSAFAAGDDASADASKHPTLVYPEPLIHPDGIGLGDGTIHNVTQKQGVVFINFDGGQLNQGNDDNSKTNTSWIGDCAPNYPAYGTGTKRQATIDAVKSDWAPFNVIISDTRPSTGDYTMCMTGPCTARGQGVLGIAPVDCEDANPNSVVFAFHSANDQFPATTQATTISQEVAHSYGLMHVSDPGDIMNPTNSGGDPTFKNECISIPSQNNCQPQHAAECGGSGDTQNSYAELMTLFGPAGPSDSMPPTVMITSPVDGQVLPAPATFEIMVTATDDVGVTQVTLVVNGATEGNDTSAPFSFPVTGLPEGQYTLQVSANDAAGNSAMSTVVNITVGDSGTSSSSSTDPSTSSSTTDPGTSSSTTDPGTSSGATTLTTGGSDETGGGEEGDEESGGESGDDGGDDDGSSWSGATTFWTSGPSIDKEEREGCGCNTPTHAPHPTWLLMLFGFGLLRRRA